MSSSKYIKGAILKDKYNDDIYLVTHKWIPVKMFGDTYIAVLCIKGDYKGEARSYPESRGKKIGMSLDEAMVELL